jgi:hypothetical protein
MIALVIAFLLPQGLLLAALSLVLLESRPKSHLEDLSLGKAAAYAIAN